MESRTPKGRAAKRGGRGGTGTPVETETRKNLRSSKGKKGSNNVNSPAKRKGRGSDGDEKSGDEKRKRTDSSRNSPDDDEDSEKDTKGGNESDKDSATSSIKGSKEDKDDFFMPKDKEEEKYIPPPPLPYALVCPKSSCKKRYRQHNGLRFHVSHAHPELLDELGNIRDTSEIEKMEKEAKERLVKAENGQDTAKNNESATDSTSGSSSKTSTPGPSETNNSTPSEAGSVNPIISVPLPPTVKGPTLDAKPIPVSAIEGGIPSNARPPAAVLQTTAAALPLITSRSPSGSSTSSPLAAHNKPIRPLVNARPIVPATGPQIMPAGNLGPSGINLKPIQPRPTIMPEPTPNLALDDLKKAKKAKKSSNSPGNSPPRGVNGNSPKTKDNQQIHNANNNVVVEPPAKSPYSDISDDEQGQARQKSSSQHLPAQPPSAPPPTSSAPSSGGLPPPPPFGFPPFGLPPTASLPTVPVSPQQAQKADAKKDVLSGPQPGTIEYEKMLLAYGFPPFPYPIPQGMDPAMHIHMVANDPLYKAKYESDRAEKERAFKEQIDRDNREKDRKAGVKLPPSEQANAAAVAAAEKEAAAAAEKAKQKPYSPMISVKPEFRQDTKKEVKEAKPEPQPKKAEDEGIKATMETRGPPPATPTSFASLMHPALMGRNPFGYDAAAALQLASMPPHILASLYGGANPYGIPGFGAAAMRPPFVPTSSSAEDLSRSAALAMAQAVSSMAGAGSGATKALDMLQQHANQYYAAAIAASAGNSTTSTTSTSSSPSSHKIHELQERALKSPVTSRAASSPANRATPTATFTTASSTTPRSSSTMSDFSSKRTPSPSSRTTPTGARSRSPPPLRHVHTHTHTHFGLGYPLLPPPSGVPGPPAAHSPFPPAGFSSKLLPVFLVCGMAFINFLPLFFAGHLLPGKPPLPGALPSFPPPK